MGADSEAAPLPDAFRRAARDLATATWRPELLVEEIPAPQRIAPFSAAVTADVLVGGEEVGSGRLVLLHDPSGNAAWQGTFRCVTFARADVDPEMVTDPLLASVGWSWLLDALESHHADYLAPSGTVTSVASESFGGMSDEAPRAEVEVRASWTPQLSDGAAWRRTWAPGLNYCVRQRGSPASRRRGPDALAAEPTEPKPPETLTELPSRPETGPEEPEPSDDVQLLVRPADGVPPVVDTPEALQRTVTALAGGTGPVAVDAERAHGFRYSQRAYLLQFRRAGAGTHLVDPVAFGLPADLSELGAALADAEWVIHAASQDLPCLFEVGLVPHTLFDTELAGRLLGYPRVALGTMVEELFGVRLLKEHSASDWSTRPLPPEWLSYAALDVELLVELRDRLAAELVAAGKWDWAQQEFAALVAATGAPVDARVDPWRRTSGIHKVRSRRGLAYVSRLWYARDAIAQSLDRAPGKILPDVAITDLAALRSPDRAALRQIPGFLRRQARKFEASWLQAVEEVTQLADSELPALHIPNDAPPQPRLWAAKDPEAAARLVGVRAVLTRLAATLDLPIENLLTPEYVRRLAWRPPSPVTEESVDAFLTRCGARSWQRELTVPELTRALQRPPSPAPVPDDAVPDDSAAD